MNLAWVIFDVSYIPLRNFWLQRNLYPLPTLPLVVPLPWLPNITPVYDRIKGIEPHRDTQRYLEQFQQLDQALSSDVPSTADVQQLLERQRLLTLRMLETNPFQSSGNTGALEKIKSRLRAHAGLESARQSTILLLNPAHISGLDWSPVSYTHLTLPTKA